MDDPMKVMLSLRGELTISPKGTSMLPFLKEKRDKVRILPFEKARKYDIVLYKVKNEYILHRIIGFFEGGYIISGDNAYFNESVGFSEPIGVVSEIIRGEKKINPRSNLFKIYCFLWYKLGIKRVVLFVKRVKNKVKRTIRKASGKTENK